MLRVRYVLVILQYVLKRSVNNYYFLYSIPFSHEVNKSGRQTEKNNNNKNSEYYNFLLIKKIPDILCSLCIHLQVLSCEFCSVLFWLVPGRAQPPACNQTLTDGVGCLSGSDYVTVGFKCAGGFSRGVTSYTTDSSSSRWPPFVTLSKYSKPQHIHFLSFHIKCFNALWV